MALQFWPLHENESHTNTYILADEGNAIIIDPVVETQDRDLDFLKEKELNLKYILETHVHADHITGAWGLKSETDAEIVYSQHSGVDCADRLVGDGDKIEFGTQSLNVILTPGHTESCTSYFIAPFVFTGDALMIRSCGRTDFQQGSSETLFHSVREKLFKLPSETLVYPSHEYKGRPFTTIDEEKRLNPRLKLEISKDEFVEIMKNLDLAQPKKIDIAVPANLMCGRLN